MITRPSGLLKYLENLNKFLRGFGVHRRNEPRANAKTFSAKKAIIVIGQVNGFFKHCISELRKIANLTRILQGPDGVCSPQTTRDLEVTLSTLKHIVGSIRNISPEYVSKLDMASLTTLVVENLFAEMRDGNDMPLVLQFAHRLSSTLRELKRNTKCSFNYFTSSSAFYSKQLGFLPFSTNPTMSKPEKDSKVTRRQLAEMWCEEFGQSVRQATVRNKSTKDNPGTLPINCYFVKPSEPQLLDFDNLLSMAPDSDEEDAVAPSSSNLFCN